MNNEFPIIKANKFSTSRRKIVLGHGINDAEHMTTLIVNGKRKMCPFYSTWHGMLMRVFSEKIHKRQPTYKNCTVSDEWLLFSNFMQWMKTQNWHGNQLDKDIISQGNKHYSKEYCVFVPHHINSLLTKSFSTKGAYPTGVSFDKKKKKYTAQCSTYGESNFLGRYCSPEEAEEAYCEFKHNHITEIASKQADKRIKAGLLAHAKAIIDGLKN